MRTNNLYLGTMKSLYGNDRLVLKKKSNLYYNIEDKNMYDIVNFDYIVPIEVNKPFMSKNKILKLVNVTK